MKLPQTQSVMSLQGPKGQEPPPAPNKRQIRPFVTPNALTAFLFLFFNELLMNRDASQFDMVRPTQTKMKNERLQFQIINSAYTDVAMHCLAGSTQMSYDATSERDGGG